jgi:hypothetical protein
MIKTTFVTAVLALAFMHPAAAMEGMMKCDHASMMKVRSEIDTMGTQAQKTMAMKHMSMAEKAMKAHKSKECTMHLDSAMKAMKKS